MHSEPCLKLMLRHSQQKDANILIYKILSLSLTAMGYYPGMKAKPSHFRDLA